MTDNTEQLTNIEIALAHHEQQIADLSEMVNLQRQEIARLHRYLDLAQSRLAELEAASDQAGKGGMSVAEIAASEKPPHY